jgi:hypothetical protein
MRPTCPALLRSRSILPHGSAREGVAVVNGDALGADYPTQARAVRTARASEPLEWNTINRGTCGNGNQCTSTERGLDRTTGNEEYVLVSYGNILSLAT